MLMFVQTHIMLILVFLLILWQTYYTSIQGLSESDSEKN